MSHHELDAQGPAWVETPALCRSLSISRSSIGRWRRRELLGHGHHWVKKNPAAPRSDLLWHRHRCSALLGPSTSERCRTSRLASAFAIGGDQEKHDGKQYPIRANITPERGLKLFSQASKQWKITIKSPFDQNRKHKTEQAIADSQ